MIDIIVDDKIIGKEVDKNGKVVARRTSRNVQNNILATSLKQEDDYINKDRVQSDIGNDSQKETP